MASKNKINFDLDADYNADTLDELCDLLIGEIMEYRLEASHYGVDDLYGMYLNGLITGKETVLRRLGVSSEYWGGDC